TRDWGPGTTDAYSGVGAAAGGKLQHRIPVARGAPGGELPVDEPHRLRMADAVGKHHVQVTAVRVQDLRPYNGGPQRLHVGRVERRLEAADQQMAGILFRLGA